MNSIDPFPRQGTFTVLPGAVFRLRSEGLQRVELPMFEEAMEDLYWARDLGTHGVPRPDSARDKMLVVTPETAKVIDVSNQPTVAQLHEIACGEFQLNPELNMIVFCNERIANMAYAGTPFDRLIAVVPKDWLHRFPRRTGVFIDAREPGEGISFHIFDSDVVRLTEISDFLQVDIPDGLQVRVFGTDGPTSDPEKHRVHPGAMLVVHTGALPALWAVDPDAMTSSSEAGGVELSTTSEDADHPRDPWRRPFYITVAVYSFQTKIKYTTLSVLPEDDVESIVEELEAELYRGDGMRLLSPAVPQPDSPHITLVADATWMRAAEAYVVLIDRSRVAGRPFAVYLRRTFSVEDVALALGDSWIEGSAVFAGEQGAPLEPGQQCEAFSGMLLQVCPGGATRPQCDRLEHRLTVPQLWANPVDPDVSVEDELLLNHVVLLSRADGLM